MSSVHFFPTVTRRCPSILLGIVWLCCMYPLQLGEWGWKVGGSAMAQSSMVERRFHWKCRQRFYLPSDLDEPIENIFILCLKMRNGCLAKVFKTWFCLFRLFFSNSVGISICKARVHGSLPECGTMVDADGFENAEKCRGSTGLF